MRYHLPTLKKIPGLDHIRTSYRPSRQIWAILFVVTLISSLHVDAHSASAQPDHQTMDTGYEQTSTPVSVDEPVIVSLTDGDTILIIEDAPLGVHFEVRSKNAGSWSEPLEVDNHGDEGPDATASGEGAGKDPFVSNIGPIWLGDDAEAVEIRASSPSDVTVTSLRPSESSAELEQTRVNGARITAGQPAIQPRAAWATSGWAYGTSGCENGPSIAERAKAVVVHHTVTSNSYSRSDVAQIIRSIYHLHVNINGWCDIGYNFVVDKFGTIWEARTGGTHNPVIGGHARGFNTDTSGIALLGQHHTGASPAAASPTSASKDAIARFTAWKLALGDISPTQTVNLTNRATNATVNLPAVLGHRDLGQTSCPGSLTMPFVRSLPELASQYVSHSAYVDALSQTFDGRPLHDNEVNYWQTLARRDGYESVANKFARSEHNVGRVVDRLYQTAFGRAADEQGRADWISRIRNGYSYQQVALHFYGSNEISRRNPDDAQYITQLYRSVLGREPSAQGVAEWTLHLRTGRFTRHQTARLFVQSTEGRQQRVQATYLDVLGRPADPAGLNAWTGYLWNGDDFSLAAKFAISREYQSNV